MALSSTLDTIRQRTGLQDLMTRTGLSNFQSAVKNDFGNIASQWNQVIHPLLSSIAEPGIDALTYGLVGNTLWSDKDATAGSSPLFWDSINARRRTIKESFDWVVLQLNTLARQAASETVNVPYVATNERAFSGSPNANDLLTILAFGSGAFALETYPGLTGIVYLYDNAGSPAWAQASAADAVTGAGALKALQLQTSQGTDYMLHKGRTVLNSSLWAAGPTNIGEVIYLSESTPGALTNVAPSASGQTVQVLGHVMDIDGTDIDVYLDIQQSYTEIP